MLPRESGSLMRSLSLWSIRSFMVCSMSSYLTMSACRGVLPRESGSLMRSLRPWSISSFRVCSVSSYLTMSACSGVLPRPEGVWLIDEISEPVVHQ